jgi:hypothetical protein
MRRMENCVLHQDVLDNLANANYERKQDTRVLLRAGGVANPQKLKRVYEYLSYVVSDTDHKSHDPFFVLPGTEMTENILVFQPYVLI